MGVTVDQKSLLIQFDQGTNKIFKFNKISKKFKFHGRD